MGYKLVIIRNLMSGLIDILTKIFEYYFKGLFKYLQKE